MLVVCIGSTTRLIESIQRMPKTYRTVIRLGARSDTLDVDGHVAEVEDPRIPDESEVRRVRRWPGGRNLAGPAGLTRH